MATRSKKPSVFTVLNQLHLSKSLDSDSSSDDERQQERKEKQKQKKKLRSKKKNSDSAQLKNLAFVSSSKHPKNKKTTVQAVDGEALEENRTNAVSQKTVADHTDDIDKKPRFVSQEHEKINHVVKKQQKKKSASSPKQQLQPPEQVSTVSLNDASLLGDAPESASKTELGAIYTPAHITITRVDGQMKRTVAVTEVMDQLLRCTQQNSQLLMVQEQLGHANRNLQDQLQRSAEIINSLQNEVTMFRQMCLNMQSEMSLLRSNGSTPDVGTNFQSQHRPPPGMS